MSFWDWLGSAANTVGSGIVQGATAVGNGIVGAENWVNHNIFGVGDVGDPNTHDITLGGNWGNTTGLGLGMQSNAPVGLNDPNWTGAPDRGNVAKTADDPYSYTLPWQSVPQSSSGAINQAVNTAVNNYLNSQPAPSITFHTPSLPNLSIPPSNSLGMTPIQVAQPQTAPAPNLGVTPINPQTVGSGATPAPSVGTTPVGTYSQRAGVTFAPGVFQDSLTPQQVADMGYSRDAQGRLLDRTGRAFYFGEKAGEYGHYDDDAKKALNDSFHPPQTAPAATPVANSTDSSGGSVPWGPLSAIAGGVAGAVGSGLAANTEANAATSAAQVQAEAAKHAADLQKDEFDRALALQTKIYNDQVTQTGPWRQAGEAALGGVTSMINGMHPFGTADFQADPGYQFRLSEGLKALQNSAAAHGNLLGGNTLKAIQGYGQDQASQEYQNAFNRYQTERGTKLNALQSLAGVGQTATNQVGQAGQNYANNVTGAGQNYANSAGNALMGGANATAGGITGAASANASGWMGGSNALINALNTGINAYMGNQFVNKLLGS